MPTPKPLTREEFALAITLHRDRLGLTQAQAAQLCGCSPRLWWTWEKAQGKTTLAVTMEGVLARLKKARVKRQ